jgi:WD40 repeat protein
MLWNTTRFGPSRAAESFFHTVCGIKPGIGHGTLQNKNFRCFRAVFREQDWLVHHQPGRISRVFKDYGDDVHNVYHHALITSDGRLVVSGGRDNNLTVWSLESGKALQSVPLEYIPRAVSFSLDGRLAVTENPYRPGALEVWDTGTGALSLALQASPGSEGLTEISFAVIPDGTMVATGLCGWIEFRDIRTGKIVKTIKPARGLIQILVDTIWKYVRI